MTLGQRIKHHREQAGLSQEQLAERMGVSRQAVTKWESDRSAPSTARLLALGQLFGTTADLLSPAPAAPNDAPAQQCAPAPPSGLLHPRWQQLLRRRAVHTLALAGGYAILYLLGRCIWCTGQGTSILGWLFLQRPQGAGSYLFGWLLHNGLFYYTAALGCLWALLGQEVLAGVHLGYFAAALLLGPIFGPNPAGAAMGQGDFAWAIYLFCMLAALPMGLWGQQRRRKGRPAQGRQALLWYGALCAMPCLAVALVLLLRP